MRWCYGVMGKGGQSFIIGPFEDREKAAYEAAAFAVRYKDCISAVYLAPLFANEDEAHEGTHQLNAENGVASSCCDKDNVVEFKGRYGTCPDCGGALDYTRDCMIRCYETEGTSN